VEAARSFGPKVRAELFGEGMARRSLERMRAPVTLHGSVPQGRVLTAMRDAHLLVSSSYDFDNQPMVVLEAIASGLPVLYCDPDLGEVIPEGGGFRTETPDAAGIVAAIARLQADPTLLTTASEAMVRAHTVTAQQAEPLVRVYEASLRTTTGSQATG